MEGAAYSSIRDLLDQNPVVGQLKIGPKRAWTNKEVATVREHYPPGGVAACLPLLPGRSASSIYQRAGALGLSTATGVKYADRQRWTASPQMDAVITRVYQGTPAKGDIKRLARTLNRPLWWVSKRATTLGLPKPRFREPAWSDVEEEFASANAHKDPENISQMMKRRGWPRSATAITVKLKRLGTPTGRNGDIEHYTANQLSKLFGIDRKGVGAWIVKGWLKADRRGTGRTQAQGGDEYWIHRRDVRKFVVENAAAIDIRKVEKFWFIELLSTVA